ncbi:zinc finger CCCH domain-containing protein 55-like isoform X2 [Gastrolobium bilobum]|uniref:zinc finger CCCH domain-containing protein 55-like isoform X2 n=1 Tax=Gastrolobium bilobum TaxID=150636 RepID=UPI002AB196F9|nr:zinc finger CCCH domain-containing protein 55-like isoform X2 [Gastrolobium bilobum]
MRCFESCKCCKYVLQVPGQIDFSWFLENMHRLWSVATTRGGEQEFVNMLEQESTLHCSKRSITALASEMSGSGRKRSSKWDLRDEPEYAPDSNAPDSKQLRSRWSSADVAGSNSSKWSYLEGNDKLKPGMGFSPKEPFSGGRGSNKDDIMNKDYRVLDATLEWDEDGSYDRKMSPGFEEWKHNRHSQSPQNGWSRSSRSQSPPHGLRFDAGVNDRNRMRSGGSTLPCRDFAAGKCRRGSQCHFLHHDNRNHEDSWESKHREGGAPRYSTPHESRDLSLKSGRSSEACIDFAKGRCRMGASCKYVHHNNSDGYGKISVDEFTREREIDRRRRDSSFEQGGGHWPKRSGDTPCKFFAYGNCRNGKNCRFSHDRQASRSPNRRVRDVRLASNPVGDHQMLDRSNLSNSVSPNRRLRDDRWGLDGNMVDADKVCDSPKRNDTVAVSDTAKLVEDKSGSMGATEPGFTAWPVKDGWGCSLDKSRVHGEPPFLSDKKEADCWIAENTGAKMHGSQSIGTDIWSGDAKMSPDWNYRVGSSNHIEEEHGQNKHGITQGATYLAASEHDRIQVLPGQGFNQNAQIANPLHSSLAVGQSQMAVPILPSRGGIVDGMQNQEVSTEKKYTVEPNIMDAGISQVSSRNPPIQNVVNKEQLAQLTDLSASLAHILGAGQQLPQLYAALNSHDAKDTPSLAKTEVPAMPVYNTIVKPDPAVGFSKQYDPMCDGMEPNIADANGVPPGIPPSKKIAEDEVEISSRLSNTGRQICGDSIKASYSEELVKNVHPIQLLPGQNTEVTKDNKEVVAEERQNSQEYHKNTKENGPLENMEQNGEPDEAKKTKDMKGVRTFKFALVEFVKELLKPTWKEGQITKEDYKTIVKKVVDKVTGTMQGAHIPQTQEKIDHYLSFSKPKLNKLVQAYVEKVQKA